MGAKENGKTTAILTEINHRMVYQINLNYKLYDAMIGRQGVE